MSVDIYRYYGPLINILVSPTRQILRHKLKLCIVVCHRQHSFSAASLFTDFIARDAKSTAVIFCVQRSGACLVQGVPKSDPLFRHYFSDNPEF